MRFDLDAIDEPIASNGPAPIALDDIDEDPDQPRREFDDHSLRELAVTIAERGLKQPVSVRPHPKDAGRWMLNFGARRLRAARLAGLAAIPAFVDQAADGYDQVIENEQREGLKPLELALFVQRRLAAGESQAEIARRLGKSPTLITMIGALIDAPQWLMDAYRSGQCRGIAELYKLRRLHERRPERALGLVSQGKRITRAVLQAPSGHQASSNDTAAPSGVTKKAAADDVVQSEPARQIRRADLLARATALCDAIESAIECMRATEPGRLAALRERLIEAAERCLTR